MSFIQLMLSQKQVVISLALVGVILLTAVFLLVGPVLYRSWKRAAAERKARQAARLAQRKKARMSKRAAQAKSAPPKRATVIANERAAAAPAPTVAAEAAEVKPAAPADPAPAPVEETQEPEAQSEAAADVQDILNSVFVDEGKNERFEVLMQDLEVPSGEELLALASRVAADLRTIMVKRQAV